MQNGVLHAADVLIDLEPVSDLRRIERHAIVVRVAVTIEIPGRIDEGVHGVGLAARRAGAARTLDVHEVGHFLERRAAGTSELHVQRQHHGQFALGHRDHAAARTVDHRNGRAPVALARHAPVFDTKRDGSFAEAFCFRFGVHAAASFRAG